MVYMSDERPPARPWYDLVMTESAVRGWGIAELARYAGVSRPTIYGWRDNLSKPRPKPVNDVADKLGIDRRRALRLAGIVATEPEPEPIPSDMMTSIRRNYAPEDQDRIIDWLRNELSPPPPTEPGEGGESSAQPGGGLAARWYAASAPRCACKSRAGAGT